MGSSVQQDIGAMIDGVTGMVAKAPALIVAGGAGDNVLRVGSIIDRQSFYSCVLTVAAEAALADGETLSLAVQIEESTDGSSFDTPEVLQASTILLSSSGGTNEIGVLEIDVNLNVRKQFVRFGVTPDLSRGATDTAAVQHARIEALPIDDRAS